MPQVFSSDSFESYQKLIEGMEYDEKMSELRALWTLQSQLETCSRALAGRLVAAGATSSMDGVGKGHVPGCPFQQPLSRPYGKRRPNKFHGCCGVDERGSFVMQDLTEGVVLPMSACLKFVRHLESTCNSIGAPSVHGWCTCTHSIGMGHWLVEKVHAYHIWQPYV